MRNEFVHEVKSTGESLERFLNATSKKKQKHYVDVFGFTYAETLEIAGERVSSKVFARENLRIAI